MLLDWLLGDGKADVQANASHPHDIAHMLEAGQNTRSGVPVNADTAMRATAVYASVRVLAESIAQLPLIVYRRQGDSKERATSHWLWELLHDRPNRWQSSFEWREQMATHLALRGNYYAFKNRVDGGRRIAELVPLHPDRMEVTQNKDRSLTYTYTTEDGQVAELPQRDVFHIRGLSFDGITGIDPIAYQRESIGLYAAAERHGANFFGNGAQPASSLKHPGNLGTEATENLRRQLQERTGGENSGTPIILEEGMEWQQIAITNENSQFLETYKFKRTEIASMFRVPPHMIGDLERATFSNIEQQSLDSCFTRCSRGFALSRPLGGIWYRRRARICLLNTWLRACFAVTAWLARTSMSRCLNMAC